MVDALEARRGFYERLGFEEVDVVVGTRRVPGTVPMVLPLAAVEAAARAPASE